MADALLNWLIDINSVSNEEIEKYTGVESASTVATFLADCAPTFELMLAYLDEHFDDSVTLKPFLSQLLYALKRGGPLRVFALQFIPTLIHANLAAVSYRRTDCAHLDAFLLCTYNLEIMDTSTVPKHNPSPDSLLTTSKNQLNVSPRITRKEEQPKQRRRDIVRVPNLRQHSIYHDPGKLSSSVLADSAVLARLTPPTCTGQDIEHFAQMQATVSIGPFPMCARITSENRYAILARLCRSVYEHLAQMHHDAVLLAICDLTVCLCRNGFVFGETDLASRVLQRAISHHQPGGQMAGAQEMNGDRHQAPMHRRSSLRLHRGQTIAHQSGLATDEFCCQPRMKVHSSLLLQLLNCVYYALFNGYHDVALEALDALHQRAKYELMADVMLMSSAVINSLLENPSGGPAETTDPMGVRIQTASSERSPYAPNARNFITNASLRMRRMAEDIPIVDEPDHAGGQSTDRTDKTTPTVKGDLPSKFRKMVKLRPDAMLIKQKSRQEKDDEHQHSHHKPGPISVMKGAARNRLQHMRHKFQSHNTNPPQIIQEAPSESTSGELAMSPPMTPQQRIEEIKSNSSTLGKKRTESEPANSTYEKLGTRPSSESDPKRLLEECNNDATVTDFVVDSFLTRESTDSDDEKTEPVKQELYFTPKNLSVGENGDGIEMRTLRHADSSTDNLTD